jgi:hypothetical protein
MSKIYDWNFLLIFLFAFAFVSADWSLRLLFIPIYS